MIYNFDIERRKRSKTRKIPFLPRFGIVIDIGDRRISFRQVPLMETVLNLIERGPSLHNMRRVIDEQIGEVKFPFGKKDRTVDVEARTVSRKSKKR